MGDEMTVPEDRTADEQLVNKAHRLNQQIKSSAAQIRTTGVTLAGRLFEAEEERIWELLDCDTEREWLADPDIELSYSHARNLTKVYREVVVKRGIKHGELDGVDLRKLQMALPAVDAGEVTIQEAIADARSLGRHDMAERYGEGGPNRRLDAGAEPERVKCPTCGAWHNREEVEGADWLDEPEPDEEGARDGED